MGSFQTLTIAMGIFGVIFLILAGGLTTDLQTQGVSTSASVSDLPTSPECSISSGWSSTFDSVGCFINTAGFYSGLIFLDTGNNILNTILPIFTLLFILAIIGIVGGFLGG